MLLVRQTFSRLHVSPHKAKGRAPCGNSPPSYPIFRRPGSAPRSQLLVTPELFETYERSPRFSYPVIPFAVRAFLFRSRLPVSRVLRESRFGVPCGLPHRFPCGSRLRCPSKFRCRSSSEPRSRFSSRVPCSVPLRVPLPVLLGGPFPALLRTPLPVLPRLLSALSFWRIAPPLN